MKNEMQLNSHQTMMLDADCLLTLPTSVCDALNLKVGDEVEYISQTDGICLMVPVGWQPNEPAVLLSVRKQ